MKDTFDDALKRVLAHEGGFSNDPRDPGGMTNLGVTKATWENWIGHVTNEKEMRNLTVQRVAPMYRRKYWDAVRGDELPRGVDYVVFDFAVNAGPGRAIKLLQSTVGVVADGALTPATLGAVQSLRPKDVISQYSESRRAFYRSLRAFPTFGRGWLRRTEEVEAAALAMLE